MTTQIMFKIDEKLKKAIQRKAQNNGMTLSNMYKMVTRSIVDGDINFGVTVDTDDWTNYTKESKISFEKGLKDIAGGRVKRIK